jgi:heme exporter protein D
MSFASFEALLAMGGHGLYVWLSYAAAVIIVGYNVVSVSLRRRRFFRLAVDQQRRRRSAGEAAAAADAVSDLSHSGARE